MTMLSLFMLRSAAATVLAPDVYATLMVGSHSTHDAVTNASGVYLWENQNILNRTLCFQRRLRELGARHPLVVLHNFDDDPRVLDALFDRTHRIRGHSVSISGMSNVHLNKLAVWDLPVRRAIFMDNDIFLRTLPDPLFKLLLPDGWIGAVAASCGQGRLAGVNDSVPDATVFNSGLLVITPDANASKDLFAFRASHKPQHACTGNFFGDQSLLNTAYRGRWVHLPKYWNFQYSYHYHPVHVYDGANVHFTGDQKPRWQMCVHDTYTDGESPDGAPPEPPAWPDVLVRPAYPDS